MSDIPKEEIILMKREDISYGWFYSPFDTDEDFHVEIINFPNAGYGWFLFVSNKDKWGVLKNYVIESSLPYLYFTLEDCIPELERHILWAFKKDVKISFKIDTDADN